MINTATVQDRRNLRFQSLDDFLADVERVVVAEKSGKLRQTGNWTAGQTFNHLASWMNYAYEGFPFKTPWFIRVLLKMKRKQYVKNGMPSGVRIPGTQDGTYATEPMDTHVAADKLRSAIRRLKSGEPAKFDSPAFGPMAPEERIALNLRHAELHLSFLHP